MKFPPSPTMAPITPDTTATMIVSMIHESRRWPKLARSLVAAALIPPGAMSA
jgi:hypothetical protein